MSLGGAVRSGQANKGGAPSALEEYRFVDQAHHYVGRRLPNAMTVDAEDYFQVSAFDGVISREEWASIPARLPRNIDKVLRLFDDEGVKGTFFTLGWVCEKYPEVVRQIAAAGHEIASHGHGPLNQ